MQITIKIQKLYNNIKNLDYSIKILINRACMLQISAHIHEKRGINSQKTIYSKAEL